MSKATKLPPMSLDDVLERYPAHRQSLLGKLDQCPLSTRFEMEGASYTSPAAARGILFHRFAAEVLQTLRRTGETTIPTEEAMVILREVEAQRGIPDHDVVLCGAHERRLLRILALKFAAVPFNSAAIVQVEDRLEATVRYERGDGSIVERKVTGRPDAILADPPGGAIVLDYKTAQSAPGEGYPPGKDDEALGVDSRVSVEGFFQQRIYAFLVLHTFPSIDRVTLREFYPLPEEVREATVLRDHLEHLDAEVALLVEILDRALEGGTDSELWKPSPGRWCAYCRRPNSCPIEAEARAASEGVTSQAQAERIAAEVSVADTVRSEGLAALKAWHEETGRGIPLRDGKGRFEWRWDKDSGGRRRFKCVRIERNVKQEAEQA